MRTQSPKAPEAITFESDYPGTADQAQHVRADLVRVAGNCPVLDDLVLLASELATNAIRHSRSGHPAGTFTVRAKLYPGDYAWVEVTDHGGTWTADGQTTSRDAGWPSSPPVRQDERATGESRATLQPRGMVPAQLAPNSRDTRRLCERISVILARSARESVLSGPLSRPTCGSECPRVTVRDRSSLGLMAR